MKTSLLITLTVLAVLGGVGAMFYWAGSSGQATPTAPLHSIAARPLGAKSKPVGASVLPVSSRLATGGSATDTPPAPAVASGSAPAPAPATAAERRIAALEAQIKSLQQSMSGISLEKASAERNALFAGEEGYLKVDEYAAVGQHAIAGEGYLTFLQHHPDHPDARDVMKKARDSFLKAGYKDKAFWVQEEIMKGYPQHQLADTAEMATLAKEAGEYGRAADYMAQAVQLETNPEQRLWKKLYWAWYVQLKDGNAAGIDALRQVQQEITTSGIKNPKLNQRAQQRMAEWQQELSRHGR